VVATDVRRGVAAAGVVVAPIESTPTKVTVVCRLLSIGINVGVIIIIVAVTSTKVALVESSRWCTVWRWCNYSWLLLVLC